MVVTFLRTVVRDRRITARNHARIMKVLMRQMMVEHLEQTIPLHFREGAENVYHMQRRTQKYLRAKFKKKHHKKPLVYSGRTLSELKASNQRITSTQYRSRLYYRSYFQLPNERRKEIEVVLQRERQAMAVNLRRWYIAHCNDPRNQTQRIRK